MLRSFSMVHFLIFASLLILLSSCQQSFETKASLKVESPLTLVDYKHPEHKLIFEPQELPYTINLHQHGVRGFFSVQTTHGEKVRIKLGSTNFASKKHKVFNVGQEWKVARKSPSQTMTISPRIKQNKPCLYGYRKKAYSYVVNAGTPYSHRVMRYKNVPDYGKRLEEGFNKTVKNYYRANLISDDGQILATLTILFSTKITWNSIQVLEKCHK